ncbi:MAG TPA: hypothetical protein VNW97_01435 [Candidatus Saccharimonadales bacterium]|jgi:hypothetical protein|nr:hypothetical protein [Candidatus Saccharimonadales bacterium]
MYLYHADALALGGTLIRPVPQVIDSKAACSLPTTGGTATARVEKFSLNGLVSFDMAQSDVAGGIETKSGTEFNVTRVSTVIEGLNILNMVMADRIVVRLAAEHGPNDPEPKIITTGCHYDGLRIAGHAAVVKTDHNLFSDLPTYSKWQADWKAGGAPHARILNSVLGSTIPKPDAPVATAPQHLRDIYKGYEDLVASPDLKPTVLSSFVTKVDGIDGTEIKNWGPIIVVPQFGTIYLGEAVVSSGQRRVNMLRLELGSPDGGTLIAGSGGSNGTTFPPV